MRGEETLIARFKDVYNDCTVSFLKPHTDTCD